MRVPWTARRSSQFIVKDISAEYSLEGLILRVKSADLGKPDNKGLVFRVKMFGLYPEDNEEYFDGF